MFSKTFLVDLSERAISSAANAALLVIGADQFDVLHADARSIVGFALGGAVLSILKGVAASRVGSPDSASLAG